MHIPDQMFAAGTQSDHCGQGLFVIHCNNDKVILLCYVLGLKKYILFLFRKRDIIVARNFCLA